MTSIRLKTEINAPAAYVFQLSRDIGLHQRSASGTQERAVAGRTSGLIHLGETVTFRGRHFGLWLEHKSEITQIDIPYSFTDEMAEGNFSSFRHKHCVEEDGELAILHDDLTYDVPFGFLGKLFDRFFLRRHLERFLKKRNAFLKKVAEEISVSDG